MLETLTDKHGDLFCLLHHSLRFSKVCTMQWICTCSNHGGHYYAQLRE